MNTTIIKTTKETALKLINVVTENLNKPVRPVMIFAMINNGEYCVSGCSTQEFNEAAKGYDYQVIKASV